MNFCKKCGALMRPGDMICSRCGTTIGEGGESSSGAKNGFASGFDTGAENGTGAGEGKIGNGFGNALGSGAGNGFGTGSVNGFGAGKIGNGFGAGYGAMPGTALDFNTAVKNDLIRKLSRYRDLLSENDELDSRIKPQSSFPSEAEVLYKKRTLMKFFWPFLVGGIAVGSLLYVISVLISLHSLMSIDPDSYSSAQARLQSTHIATDVYGGYIVAVLVGLGVILIGLKIAKSKRDAFNSNAEFMNMQATDRYEKGLMNQKMINLRQDNIQQMRQYENLVPEKYRSAYCVGEIINFIKDDKAANVEEACELLENIGSEE